MWGPMNIVRLDKGGRPKDIFEAGQVGVFDYYEAS